MDPDLYESLRRYLQDMAQRGDNSAKQLLQHLPKQ